MNTLTLNDKTDAKLKEVYYNEGCPTFKEFMLRVFSTMDENFAFKPHPLLIAQMVNRAIEDTLMLTKDYPDDNRTLEENLKLAIFDDEYESFLREQESLDLLEEAEHPFHKTLVDAIDWLVQDEQKQEIYKQAKAILLA